MGSFSGRDEQVQLSFIKYSPERYKEERPFCILAELPDGFQESNVEYEFGPTQRIIDVRGHEDDYQLEKHGFTFQTWKAPVLDWRDEDTIRAIYIPAVKELVKRVMGGDVERVELFDWRLRNARSLAMIDEPNAEGSPQMTKIAPAKIVHVDQSAAGVLDRMHRYLGEEMNDIISRYRIRVINVWKPLVPTVEDMPLALCDARTVDPSDLVEIEFVLEDYVRRTYMLKYNPNMQFYYLNKMTSEEAIVFKVFDSAEVDAKYVPHAAFRHPDCSANIPPRESIEVRLLVISKQ